MSQLLGLQPMSRRTGYVAPSRTGQTPVSVVQLETAVAPGACKFNASMGIR